MLQGGLDRADDAGQGLLQGFENLVGVDGEAARHALGQIAALDLNLQHLVAGEGGADFLLNALGGGVADEDAVVAADVVDDGFVETVAADAHGGGIDDAVEGDHAHFRGAAADVQHHGAARLMHRQARADGRRHGLFDQKHLAGAGAGGRFADGAALHLGGAVGDADQHPRAGAQKLGLMHRADEMLEHFLRDREVGDYAVLQRADGLDVARGAAQHALGLFAHRRDGFGGVGVPSVLTDGDDRGFIEDDALATHVDQRVGGAEINGQIGRKQAADFFEHGIRGGRKGGKEGRRRWPE